MTNDPGRALGDVASIARVVGGTILSGEGWIAADVEIAGDVISAVSPRAEELRPPDPAAGVVDASGMRVAPGLVDLQINGGFGYDLTGDPSLLWRVGSSLPRTGVTSFLPTIVSAPLDVARRALGVLAGGPPDGYLGAVPLGLHLEGPMLAPGQRGVHEERHLRLPALEVIEGWSREAGVRLVTLAPELPGADRVIAELVERDVVISAGHSEASFERAREAFGAGVRFGTHLFNAMSGSTPGEPGLAGALMAEPTVPAGLIVDGIHVHPGTVAAAWVAKGPAGIVLVTDAVAPMGTAPDVRGLSLGDTDITVDGAAVRDGRGRLAGSSLSLDLAVRNLVAFAGAGLAEALAAASTSPARVIGEPHRGEIRVGATADLVLLDDALEVVATIVGGRMAFDRRVASADESRAGP